jgi:hypothetical protein
MKHAQYIYSGSELTTNRPLGGIARASGLSIDMVRKVIR